MPDISVHQLAELVSGIARAQAAVIQGIESAMPGSRTNHIVPALQVAARLRDHPDPTFADLPSRVLMSYMGRIGPNVETIAQDLERLIAQGDGPQATASAGTAPAATTDAPGGANLDFSSPGS